jgi:hypothetical protein
VPEILEIMGKAISISFIKVYGNLFREEAKFKEEAVPLINIMTDGSIHASDILFRQN